MQLSKLHKDSIATLKRNKIENAEFEVNWIFMQVLNFSHANLVLNAKRVLGEKQIAQIKSMLARRIKGEPLAYILGNTDFYGINFFTDSRALIPRQDTESIIDFILTDEHIKNAETDLAFKGDKLKLLDIGTGTGAIGLTIKRHKPNWDITLSDISLDALELAKKNADNLALPVKFLHSNLFQNIDDKFDIIISNPPYIAENDKHLEALKYEPPLALVANLDGLEILQNIIRCAKNYLNASGLLVLEHGYNQAERILNLLNECGFKNTASKKDLAGNFRFSYGTIK